MHVDETSIRVEKHNHWIHVCSAGDITLKFVHEKRGLEAMTAIGIIPRYAGVIVHDCWASYLSYEHCGHGLCGAHLLRELTFILEANGYAWAGNMKRLLQQTCSRVSKRKRKRLTPHEYDALQKRYRNILPRRAGSAHEQGQAESLRLLPQVRVRPGLLPHLELSADHGQPRLQSPRRYPNGPIRSALRRNRVNSYAKTMKTIVPLIAFLALSGCGGGASVVLPPVSMHNTVVFMGDSITARWGQSAYADPTLVQLVPGSFNEAISGQNSNQMLARFVTDVIALHPTIVVIEAGTNDLAEVTNYNRSPPGPPATINAIAQMADEAQGVGARVLIASVIETSMPQYEVSAAMITDFNDQLQMLCADYGYTYLNYQAVLQVNGQQNPADFVSDQVHPSVAGFNLMWGVLQAGLREVGRTHRLRRAGFQVQRSGQGAHEPQVARD